MLERSGVASASAADRSARNIGVSSILRRRYSPMAPSGSAMRNGTRQPQESIASSDRLELRTNNSRAPNSRPVADAAGRRLDNMPRLLRGAYSLMNAAALAISPPAEKP